MGDIIEKPYEGDDFFEAGLKILRFHQLWPKSAKNTNIFFFKLKAFLVMILFSLFPMGCVLHLLDIAKNGTKFIVFDLIEDIALIASSVGLYYNMILFVVKHTEIAELIANLADFSRFGQPANLQQVKTRMSLVVYGFYIYCLIGVVFYSIFGILGRGACERDAVKQGVEKVCGLLANTKLPFSLDVFPRYEIYIILQLLSTMLVYTIGPLVVAFTGTVVEILTKRIHHFNGLFRQVFQIEDELKRKQAFTNCIQYHIDIIKLCDRINKIFGSLFLSYLGFSSLIISVIGLQFMLGMSIPVAIYDTNWYHGDISMQKDVSLMLARSQRYLHLSASGFGVMCFATFKAILTTAYSYLAVFFKTL